MRVGCRRPRGLLAFVLTLQACASRVGVPPPSVPSEPARPASSAPRPADTTAFNPPLPAPVAPSPVPIPSLTPGLRWFRDSAEYRALTLQTYALATRRVEAAAAARANGSWAVVLDVDETVLDNSPFQKECELAGQPYTDQGWLDWVRRRQAPLIPGARSFVSRVKGLGGVVAFVTNRAEAVCEDTRATLRDRGVPYDVVLCRPDDAGGDKNPRFESLSRGTATAGLPPLELVAYIGDNIRDFPGLDQEVRLRADEAFGGFGERFFLLPNPLYGSWEKNPPRPGP
jgi:5'-nucleotidase (lipoprotein e(P4) family)